MEIVYNCTSQLNPVWLEKIAQRSIKVAKNDFTRKMIDFITFTKIAQECGRCGQINCCQRLWKVAQSPINCPIWSHCLNLNPQCTVWIGFIKAKITWPRCNLYSFGCTICSWSLGSSKFNLPATILMFWNKYSKNFRQQWATVMMVSLSKIAPPQ